MTTPNEEKKAIQHTYDFLVYLKNSKRLNPEEIRQEARRLMRHYPTNYSLDKLYPALRGKKGGRMKQPNKPFLEKLEQKYIVLADACYQCKHMEVIKGQYTFCNFNNCRTNKLCICTYFRKVEE